MSSLARNLEADARHHGGCRTEADVSHKELERQRSQRLDAILQEEQNPAAIAGVLFPRLLYGLDHPYGHPVAGIGDSVKSLTVDDLKAFHAANYMPDNSSLIFVGDVTLDQAVALATDEFGAWKKGAGHEAGDIGSIRSVPNDCLRRGQAGCTAIANPRRGPRTATYGQGTTPWRSSTPFLAAASSTRLNLNLREDKGYSYGAFNSFVYRSQGGYWSSAAGVRTDVTKESLVEFVKELRGIAGERPVTAEELADAKANLVRGYAQRFESNDQVAGEIGTLFVYGLPLSTLGEYESAIESVTPEQVAGAARKYVDPNKSIILVVGDRAKIEEGLRSLNLGRLVVVTPDGKAVAE